MRTNRHIIAKLTRAFDQAAVARGGHYKPQPCTHDHVERTTHSFYRFRCTDCGTLVSELSEAARAQMQPTKNHTRTLACGRDLEVR